MADGRVLPYLDIPFQHASARILKLMSRPAAAEDTLERIAAWRRAVPDITIRSTFIVGFPGETERGLRRAPRLAAQRSARPRRLLRIFAGRGRRGERAASSRRFPTRSSSERRARFMELAAEISAKRLAEEVGRTLQVLDRPHGGRRRRSRARASDAPEIDGVVRILDGERAEGRRLGRRCASPKPAPTISRGGVA